MIPERCFMNCRILKDETAVQRNNGDDRMSNPGTFPANVPYFSVHQSFFSVLVSTFSNPCIFIIR